MIRGSSAAKAHTSDGRMQMHQATFPQAQYYQRVPLAHDWQSAAQARAPRAIRGTTTTAEVMPSKAHEATSRAAAENHVVVFLKQCGLQMYAGRLLAIGFDELEMLYDIDDAEMQELGMPPYHVNRLRKGLQQQQQQQQEQRSAACQGHGRLLVISFLGEHNMEQYANMLLDAGFDEMETLLEVDDLDLKDLGLPRGHALKLKRHLREYQSKAHPKEMDVCSIARPVGDSGRAQPRPSQHVLEASSTMKGDVQRSWETILKLGTAVVGERIYRYFFEMVPEAMAAFPVHVRRKYREWTADETDEEGDLLNSSALRKLFGKVLNAIGCVVAGLQDTSKLVPLLTSLGRRHIGYAVSEAWWPLLGKAIIMALSDILGDAFTSEVENAWTVVYGFASSIMIAGLREAREAATQMKSKDVFDCTKSENSRVSTRSCITTDFSSESSIVDL